MVGRRWPTTRTATAIGIWILEIHRANDGHREVSSECWSPNELPRRNPLPPTTCRPCPWRHVHRAFQCTIHRVEVRRRTCEVCPTKTRQHKSLSLPIARPIVKRHRPMDWKGMPMERPRRRFAMKWILKSSSQWHPRIPC